MPKPRTDVARYAAQLAAIREDRQRLVYQISVEGKTIRESAAVLRINERRAQRILRDVELPKKECARCGRELPQRYQTMTKFCQHCKQHYRLTHR